MRPETYKTLKYLADEAARLGTDNAWVRRAVHALLDAALENGPGRGWVAASNTAADDAGAQYDAVMRSDVNRDVPDSAAIASRHMERGAITRYLRGRYVEGGAQWCLMRDIADDIERGLHLKLKEKT